MLNMISGLARTLYIILAIVAGFVALGTVNVALWLVFLGLVKALTTTVLVETPKEPVLERANRLGRWLFPLAMLGNLALAFLI